MFVLPSLPSIHFVHITVRSLSHRHQREQNYASRREVAHIKSRKRCEKKSFTTSCARILAHILVSLVATTRVLGVGIVGERAIEISRGKKAEL